jgi:DNA polymerase-3 subunit alpha
LFLLVRGKVAPRWNGGDELEFKPVRMDLLEDLASKAEKLTVELPLDLVAEDTIGEIEEQLVKNQGKTLLRFLLVDPQGDMKIQMFSRTRSVLLTPELKSYLQKHSFINFHIN